MTTITPDEIRTHRADTFLPPDAEFADAYRDEVAAGRKRARDASVAFVAICRNAMPWLPLTLPLVEETGRCFREWRAFVYENDSEDETKEVLAEWSDGEQRQVALNLHNRPHLNHTTEPVRTHALAEYRTACQWAVRHGPPVDYVIVFDTDPWGGWSIDGVLNSLAWLERLPVLYGLASYSWCETQQPFGPFAMHYDAFAARLNHWTRRDQQWFHHWHPVVGSPPVPFRSAFGQLAIYRGSDYLAGKYSGEDCEHVCFHRSIHGATGRALSLNPSMRCVSFWVPDGG